MRNFLCFLFLINSSFAYSSEASYRLDMSHSHVGFKIRHLGISTVKGSFDSFKGTGRFDLKTKKITSITIEIQANSINTKSSKRDKHLRNEDFFHTSKYPIITFVSKKIDYHKTTKHPVKITGDLQIHGITNSVSLDVTWGGHVIDPWGNEKIGFEAEGEIDRQNFGLTWSKPFGKLGGLTVANKVKLEIQVEATKIAETKGPKPKKQKTK